MADRVTVDREALDALAKAYQRESDVAVSVMLAGRKVVDSARPVDDTAERVREVLPAEEMALSVALAQIRRGEQATPNVGTMCVLALARLTGSHDYTQPGAALDPPAVPRCEECGGQMVQGTDEWFCAACGGRGDKRPDPPAVPEAEAPTDDEHERRRIPREVWAAYRQQQQTEAPTPTEEP